MNKGLNRLLSCIVGLCFSTLMVNAQQSTVLKLSVDELFNLTKAHHPHLQVSKTDIAISNQQVKVAQNQHLPQLSAGLQAYYLGDAHILDKDFSNATRVALPHFGNSFSIDATQLIWKGNLVNHTVQTESLREDLAKLNYQNNEQSIKLLVLGYYLDLYKLHNQAAVYSKNIELAQQRLKNITKFFNQGMVTKNDLIRGELQLSNLKLSLEVLDNNQQILNKQLTSALGLEDHIEIKPVDDLLKQEIKLADIATYKALAQKHPSKLMSQKTVDLYDMASKITKAERMPALAAFAGSGIQRPITSQSPALDMYNHGWSAGLSLSFNIDALYKTPKKIKLNKMQKDKAMAQVAEMDQIIDVSVTAAYIKYNESLSQNKTLKMNKDLTVENYRIMESKYNNQLAILLDYIDASNAMLDAELQFANSEINIVYAHYKLLKEAGSL